MDEDGPIVTMYSDYVCPFCYLGRKSLESFRAEHLEELSIEWHPYDLRRTKRDDDGAIDHSIDDGKDEAYFDQVRRNVDRLREKYDASEMLSIDDRPDHVDSYNAQAASLFVQTEHPQQWEAFDDALFRALWIDGRDIGDPDVIDEIAKSVGLDAAAVSGAISDDTLTDRLDSLFAQAQERGVTGVPTFVANGRAARGAVPPEQLRRLFDEE